MPSPPTNSAPLPPPMPTNLPACFRTLLCTTLLAALLAACSLLSPGVDSATRDTVANNAQPGMAMTTARANLESSGFTCTTRQGSYFDENGEEFKVDGTFVSCLKTPSQTFNFACTQRAQVILVPNGSRLARVVVDMAPACTDIQPTTSGMRRDHR